MLFPHTDLVVVFCTSCDLRIIRGNYPSHLIEFTQQHPTPPREVIANLVITSLFFWPNFEGVCGASPQPGASEQERLWKHQECSNYRMSLKNRYALVCVGFTGSSKKYAEINPNSAVPLGIRILEGPVFRGKADAPEAGIRSRKFEGDIKFPDSRGRDQFHFAVAFLRRTQI